MTCSPSWTWLRSRARASGAFLLVGAMSCGNDDLRRRTYVDVGRLCLLQAADSGPMTVLVIFDDVCLSCAVAEGSCSATVEGTRVEMKTSLELTYIEGECQSDCGWASATCELELPAAGNYGFGWKSRFDTAMVPPETDVPLLGNEEGCQDPTASGG
jgi:hypothetical protein